MGHGYLTQKSAFRKLKDFEEEEICLYTSKVLQSKQDLDAKSYEKVPPPELNEIEENESQNSMTFSMILRSRKN